MGTLKYSNSSLLSYINIKRYDRGKCPICKTKTMKPQIYMGLESFLEHKSCELCGFTVGVKHSIIQNFLDYYNLGINTDFININKLRRLKIKRIIRNRKPWYKRIFLKHEYLP